MTTMRLDSDSYLGYISWYKEMFGFTSPAVITLYNDQQIRGKDTLGGLTDFNVDTICCSIG